MLDIHTNPELMFYNEIGLILSFEREYMRADVDEGLLIMEPDKLTQYLPAYYLTRDVCLNNLLASFK